jgi:endoglucanase
MRSPIDRRIVLALIVALLIPASFATAQPMPIAVHVEGNRLVDAAGASVQLRGVNRSGTEYMCIGGGAVFDGPSDQASVDAMKVWSVNAVRIPVNEQCWLGVNGLPGNSVTVPMYRQQIQNFVALLTSNGIYSIIDLQWANAGETRATLLTAMPDADHAPAFWQSIAETFKSNQAVIFDLFNEPFPDNNRDTDDAWRCLRDGGTCAGVSYQAAGMQQLVDTIRATGSGNVIMSPGVQYTNGLTQWLAFKPNDPTGNLAAAWHSYAGQICSSQACFDAKVAPVAAVVPVIVAEIGENDCQSVFINPLMDWLDAHQVSYLAWAWNTYDCGGFPSLISSFDGTPTSFGVAYRNHILARAGRAVPTPVPIPMLNDAQLPFGIHVGSRETYIGADGTPYLPDVAGPALAFADARYFQPYSTTIDVEGTPDPQLYQTGRFGIAGTWTMSVPNGSYRVSLGTAPTGTWDASSPRWDWSRDAPNQPFPPAFTTGEYGQDQVLQSAKMGTCVWSSKPQECPTAGGVPAPPPSMASVVSYTVDVFNQHLSVQVASSFGDGRTTVLNMIKVEPVPAPADTST